jgi:hypothetical protein
MRKPNIGPIRFRADAELLRAIEQAAAQDERTKSDWVRIVVKRELRNRGLLEAARPSRS